MSKTGHALIEKHKPFSIAALLQFQLFLVANWNLDPKWILVIFENCQM